MCKYKSGIILRSKVVLAPEGNESHSDLLESLGIEDSHLNASKTFVRVELIPQNDNKASDIDAWRFNVDQDIVPDWYGEDPKRYEQEFRNAVRALIKDRFVVVCGRAWTAIKSDECGTYYLLDGVIESTRFGKNNNYAESYIRENLISSELARALHNEFGDRIVPIHTDLTSMDGYKDYGVVEGDMLSIPTFDLYRECGEKIPLIDKWYWLATPNQTPSRKDSGYVQYVDSDGGVSYDDCDWGDRGVRPFFILKS